MQYADEDITWREWIDQNAAHDDATKLAALREYIMQTARKWVGRENITAEWINKKLGSLGIADRIEQEAAYTLSADATGRIEVLVYARNRTEAMEKFIERVNGTATASVRNVQAVGDATFTSGREDPAPPDPEAGTPQTVDATLAEFRELLMLAIVSGPRVCVPGVNDVLYAYDLPSVPPTRTFTVERPVEATVSTTVTAYDEATARRIAGWRWDNNRKGFQVKDLAPGDLAPMTVSEI